MNLLPFGKLVAHRPRSDGSLVRRFFQPNIDRRGRLARGGIAVLLFLAGGVIVGDILWLGIVFFSIGGFALFEAVRGWCLARACGIKTKL